MPGRICLTDLDTGRLVKVSHEGVPLDRLPGFEFEGAEKGWYGDLENVNRAWGDNLSVASLVDLTIQGAPVLHPNAILRGIVRIENKSQNVIDLTANKSLFPTNQEGRIISIMSMWLLMSWGKLPLSVFLL